MVNYTLIQNDDLDYQLLLDDFNIEYIFCSCFCPTNSLIMTLANQLTLPHRDLCPTLLQISGRSEIIPPSSFISLPCCLTSLQLTEIAF